MKIFASYSNDDIAHVNSFSKIFAEINTSDFLFVASEKIQSDNYKKAVPPGTEWKVGIAQKINESNAAILFLSKSFFNSDEVVDFELPLILEKASKNEEYTIFPIWVDDFNSIKNKDAELISKKEFLNTAETSLSKLRGSLYNLELQNISKKITSITTNTKQTFLKSPKKLATLIISVTTLLGAFYFLLPDQEQQPEIVESVTMEETTTTTLVDGMEVNYIDFNTIGIGDCVNLDLSLTTMSEFSPYKISFSEPVSCDLKHDAEIIKKFTVSRINTSELIFPGVYFGIFTEEDCYAHVGETLCDGVIVKEILDNFPAASTSLEPGDVITSVNGISTDTNDKLSNYLSYLSANENITFSYYRPDENGVINKSVIYDDVLLAQERITNDGLQSIVESSMIDCAGENSLYQTLEIDFISSFQSLEINSPFRTTISKPVFNKNDIGSESFTVLCFLFVAETKITNTNPIEYSEIQILKNTILFGEEFYKEWGYETVKNLYASNNDFKQIAKTFNELNIGDCFDWNLLNSGLNAEESNYITFINCSLQYQDVQIIGEYKVSKQELIDNELFIESSDFINYLSDKCYDLGFQTYKESIWIGLTSRYVDDNGIVNKGYFFRPLWIEDNDEIIVKCAFSYTLGKGFERFNNVYDDQPNDNDIVQLSFSHCPKYTFTGTEYTFKNNKVPMTDNGGLSFVVPSWNTGKYPITKFGFYTNNENVKIVGLDNETGISLDPLERDSYLFEDNKGVVPFLYEIISDYEGEVTFAVRADDAGGGNAWAECTTTVVKNASSNEILEISDFGKISSNSWDSELSFKTSTEQKLEELNLPLIESIKNKTTSDLNFIEVKLTKPLKNETIKRVNVKYVLCDSDSITNCINNHNSKFNFLEFDSDKFDFLNNQEIYEVLEIPLYFYSCNKQYLTNLDFDCLVKATDQFAILEYIYIDLDDPFSCNVAYKGFTRNEEYLRKTNPENTHIKFYKDILFGENQLNTDSDNYSQNMCKDLELSKLPFTENALLFNYHYYPNFNFSSIFSGQLYAGTPVIEINLKSD